MSYVTQDLGAAMDIAGKKLGIDHFHVIDTEYAALVGGEVRDLRLKAAIANTERHQFEIIQPVSGAIEVYTDDIDYRGRALAFHHVGLAVTGPFASWEAVEAEVCASGDGFVVVCPPEPEPDPKVRYGYVDTRAWCGHYTEYLWWAPELNGNPAFPDLS